MPPEDQLGTAILWLRGNEGDGSEGEACRAVADWIEHLQVEANIRWAARKVGVTTATMRRKLAERSA